MLPHAQTFLVENRSALYRADYLKTENAKRRG